MIDKIHPHVGNNDNTSNTSAVVFAAKFKRIFRENENAFLVNKCLPQHKRDSFSMICKIWNTLSISLKVPLPFNLFS